MSDYKPWKDLDWQARRAKRIDEDRRNDGSTSFLKKLVHLMPASAHTDIRVTCYDFNQMASLTIGGSYQRLPAVLEGYFYSCYTKKQPVDLVAVEVLERGSGHLATLVTRFASNPHKYYCFVIERLNADSGKPDYRESVTQTIRDMLNLRQIHDRHMHLYRLDVEETHPNLFDLHREYIMVRSSMTHYGVVLSPELIVSKLSGIRDAAMTADSPKVLSKAREIDPESFQSPMVRIVENGISSPFISNQKPRVTKPNQFTGGYTYEDTNYPDNPWD